ncbi:MAG TPA: hypothetical protein PK505_00320 [Treponemataceae bacterium]|nr:hypothetical protein [Treponemataceae bacterium]
MKKSILFLFILSFWFVGEINAELKKEGFRFLLDDETYAELIKNESLVSISYRKKEKLKSLAPKATIIDEAKKKWHESHDIDPLIVVEGLFLYTKPKNEKNFISHTDEIAKTASILTAFSKMKGMEYYSERKKRKEILYEDCFVIESYENQVKVPDPKAATLENLHLLARQTDTTFGSYVMDVAYVQKDAEIAMYMKNLDPLKYLLFKAIQEDNLHLFLYTHTFEEHILVYFLVQAAYLDVAFLNETIEKSLKNRVDAIYEWSKIQYEG